MIFIAAPTRGSCPRSPRRGERPTSFHSPHVLPHPFAGEHHPQDRRSRVSGKRTASPSTSSPPAPRWHLRRRPLVAVEARAHQPRRLAVSDGTLFLGTRSQLHRRRRPAALLRARGYSFLFGRSSSAQSVVAAGLFFVAPIIKRCSPRRRGPTPPPRACISRHRARILAIGHARPPRPAIDRASAHFHCGLGRHEAVRKSSVAWPSGGATPGSARSAKSSRS